MANERRFRYAGHILRFAPVRLLKMAMHWEPQRGRRKQGRLPCKDESKDAGLSGNEEADAAAAEGVLLPQEDVALDFSTSCAVLQRYARRLQQRRYEDSVPHGP